MHWSLCWAVCIPLVAGCDIGAGSAEARLGGVTSRKAEPTPEIIAKAEALLKEHPDASVGTELPFRLKGKAYVGRVEQHENASGDPGRPPGKHKGITVYVAE